MWQHPLEFVILGLATWRLTSLAVYEDGPWDFLARLRHLIGVRYDEKSEPYGENVIATLLTCVWCASPWLAVLLLIGFAVNPTVTLWIASPFALSAIAVMVEEFNRHGSG